MSGGGLRKTWELRNKGLYCKIMRTTYGSVAELPWNNAEYFRWRRNRMR